jgi:hypothetical protein
MSALPIPCLRPPCRYTVNASSDKEQAYVCTFRASTCVDVSPKDTAPTSYPLYDRAHLRTDKVPMKKANPFIAERIVRDW